MLKKIITAESLWSLWNLLKENWIILLPVIGGGGLMGYLTYLTDWLNNYGPIAWGVAFIGGAFSVLCLILLYQSIMRRMLASKDIENAMTSGANPLHSRFEKQSINLSNWFDPSYSGYENKRFDDCFFSGPAMLVFEGAVITDVVFRHCQIVIIRKNSTLFGAIKFVKPRITGGVFYNLTLAITKADYDKYPADIKENVSVIHDI